MRLLSFVFVLSAFGAMNASAQVDKYSINLMWINRSYSPEQTYIRPAKDESELIQKLILPVCKWAKMNPEADVTLWYHGDLVSAEAVERTKRILEAQLTLWGNVKAQLKRTKRILEAQLTLWGNVKAQLKDLRQIPIVAANPTAFSDRTPVYLRVDLLKFVVVLDSIERNKMDAAIFADLEIGDLREDGLRMGKAELFNAKVMADLNEMGLVIGNGVENQFIQVLKGELIVDAIKNVIINVNLARMEAALNYVGPKRFWVMQELWKSAFHSVREDIWRYVQTNRAGRVKVCLNAGSCGPSELVDWQPQLHGYAHWGLYFFHPDCEGLSTIVDGKCQEPRIRMPFKTYLGLKMATRNDLEVRGGNSHSGDMNQFVERERSEPVKVIYWN